MPIYISLRYVQTDTAEISKHTIALRICIWCVYACKKRVNRTYVSYFLPSIFFRLFVFDYIFYCQITCANRDLKRVAIPNSNQSIDLHLIVPCT